MNETHNYLPRILLLLCNLLVTLAWGASIILLRLLLAFSPEQDKFYLSLFVPIVLFIYGVLVFVFSVINFKSEKFSRWNVWYLVIASIMVPIVLFFDFGLSLGGVLF